MDPYKREQELEAKGIKVRKVHYSDILHGTCLKTVIMLYAVYTLWNLDQHERFLHAVYL